MQQIEILYNTKFEFIKETRWVRAYISKQAYCLCDQRAHDRWSQRKRKSNYNSGLINTVEDSAKAERIGLLGEVAYGSLINQEVDFSYREGGDGKIDFKVGRQKIDVKCAYRNYGKGLIYSVNDFGKEVPIEANKFCFMHIIYEDREEMAAEIEIAGYATIEQVKSKPLVIGMRTGSKHYNREIPYHEMIPIARDEFSFMKVLLKNYGYALDKE